MENKETVGSSGEEIKLTNADREVLARLNRGYYLIYKTEIKDYKQDAGIGECLTLNGTSNDGMVKAGTIAKLLRYGLIKSCGEQKHNLTDAGRTYRDNN